MRRAREHQGGYLYGADSAFKVEFSSERYAWELIGRDVREEGAGVQIDRVAAGRPNDEHSLGRDVIA